MSKYDNFPILGHLLSYNTIARVEESVVDHNNIQCNADFQREIDSFDQWKICNIP